uniref:ATP synthase subunit a n=1 Tax=Xiphinema pachtaicum TaxID=260251 RepID=A0A1P8C781_9BILA|nr:ATP synthase F0 subunit 6 [Xiphinema pachtaicum]AOT84265.1 ATP synthase F0 subunit 6 [Xiphinema pachtaicum]
MTSLFNIFCPLMVFFDVYTSMWLVVVTIIFMGLIMKATIMMPYMLLGSFFKSSFLTNTLLSSVFVSFSLLNMMSLSFGSYPVTTTVLLNFFFALLLWTSSILLIFLKKMWISSFMPLGSPWYLASFLALIEFTSILVRPITLAFRLFANMTAGHIILGLSCGAPIWMISGVMVGMLECVVAIIQAFVFSMLVLVYLEESFSHY